MSHSHQLTDASLIKKFILAGNARFTLVSAKTGVRFTFKARALFDDDPFAAEGVSSTPKLWFVSVLTGADNESDFSFLGTIFADNLNFVHGKKSRIGRDAPSARAFPWFWQHLQTGALPAGVEFWHEGSCAACGRALTVPESIALGFGPDCAAKLGL